MSTQDLSMVHQANRAHLKRSDHWLQPWQWVTLHFVLSRSCVFLLVLAIPYLTDSLVVDANGLLGAIAHWDGGHYQDIALNGYEFVNDGKGYNVAFFPLFPLILRLLMLTGLPFVVAAWLFNNLCFWIILMTLFLWMQEKHNERVARWSVIFLAWFPLSFFCSVAYTESLFLLTTLLALVNFDHEKYIWAGIWGALASATRFPGIVLIPTFLVATLLQRRSPQGYITSLCCGVGGVAYSLYCYLKFDEPLAFVLVQSAWEEPPDFFLQNWWILICKLCFGNENWVAGNLVDPVYPLVFVFVITLIALLYWRQSQLPISVTNVLAVVFGLILWLLGGDHLIAFIMMFGGFWLSIKTQKKLDILPWLYTLFSFLLLIATGRTFSITRLIFGIVTISPMLSLYFEKSPRLKYSILLFFALFFVTLSLRFGQGHWVA